jgi:diacylglycerol kinase
MIIKKNPFSHAFKGLKWFAVSQWNFKIHAAATILVLFMSIYFKLNKTEWLFIILAIAIVWLTELLNTAIEFALDKLHPEHDELVGKAKDMAAAAVLVASLAALIVGAFIFIPKIIDWF